MVIKKGSDKIGPFYRNNFGFKFYYKYNDLSSKMIAYNEALSQMRAMRPNERKSKSRWKKR
jgi:hypothetical protein